MDDRNNTCPICERNILNHSYFIHYSCCHRNVHRNCTPFSGDEFTAVQTGALWCCRICNENIFPFNNIDDDHELYLAITNNDKIPLDNNHQNDYSESKIFDPFEINENEKSIIEYQGELDPDEHNFNQLAHHLSRSSNYYSEDSFSKLIRQKGISSEDFPIIHTNIRSAPANLSSLLSYMSNLKLCFSVIVFFFRNMAVSILIRYLWHKWIQACWIDQGYGKGRRCVSVYSRKKLHVLYSVDLV